MRFCEVITPFFLGGLKPAGSGLGDIDGRPARTIVDVLGYGRGVTAVSIRLETGRKHQIRKHAAMAGYPVLGDRRYGSESGRAWPRLALHASLLEFTHPLSGEILKVHSPIPNDLSLNYGMDASIQVRAGYPQSPENTDYRCFLSDLAGFTGSSLRDPTLTWMDGGERGIRTPGKFPYTRFPSVHLKPLGHLSPFPACSSKWRREGDSNPRYANTHSRFRIYRLQPLGHLSSRL